MAVSAGRTVVVVAPMMAILAAACSGTPVYLLPAPADGGGGADGGASTDGGVSSSALAAGSCAFTLVTPDGKSTAVTGIASSSMDGTGNVIMRCTDWSAVSQQGVLELWLGNGTYDGPRTYLMDASHSDGTVHLTIAEKTQYDPTSSAKSGCTANVDGPGDAYLTRGLVLRGTFTCESLTDRKAGVVSLASGAFSAPTR